jgi:hypothetical protein
MCCDVFTALRGGSHVQIIIFLQDPEFLFTLLIFLITTSLLNCSGISSRRLAHRFKSCTHHGSEGVAICICGIYPASSTLRELDKALTFSTTCIDLGEVEIHCYCMPGTSLVQDRSRPEDRGERRSPCFFRKYSERVNIIN